MRKRLRGLAAGWGRLLGRDPGSEEDSYRLSTPLSDAEILEIYEGQVLTQEFYGDAYAPSLGTTVSPAQEDMAEAIVETFAPARVLDVGCGLGQLVVALRRRGVDAVGCDYSEAFLRLASDDARPHLHRLDVTALDLFDRDEFDLVLCMEVLEHLPVGLVHRCVDEMQRVARGPIVVTTPSFGPNWPGRAGLPLDHPSWREDALAGRRFSQIVIAPDGRPHHGHLTLAGYDWWTSLFAGHGLIRERDIENAWLENPERPLWHHRWNIYVLGEVSSPAYIPGETCHRQGGVGWHRLEAWGDQRIRWSAARARLHLRVPYDDPALRMTLWSGPAELLRPRLVEVTARALPAGPPSSARLGVEPGSWCDLVLADVPARTGDLVEVTFDVPEPFRPDRLSGDSSDGRSLGVAVRRVVVADQGGRIADATLTPPPPVQLIGDAHLGRLSDLGATPACERPEPDD